MQKVQVDDNGTELAYIDSGAPPGDSYTTFVCIHGITYHSRIFTRLFPLAQKYNMRIIALNRRDHVGSTLFSETELRALKGDDESAKEDFLKARGLEIARFLVWVIKELKVPPASDDGKTGGLALLGWSLGTTAAMAFLGNLHTYPEDVVQTLEPYITTLFLYDPNNCLGYDRPEGSYHVVLDTTLSDRIKGITFGKWVSSYYEHPAYPLTLGVDSNVQAGSVFPTKNRTIDGLEQRAPKKPARPCTLDKLTPRELLDCLDAAAWARSDLAIWWLPTELLHAQTCRAMLLQAESDTGTGAESTTAVLPKLRIRVLCGMASLWVVQWEVWAFEEECLKWADEGKNVRPIKFIPLEGANHFMHWDDAETFMKVCSENIKS